MVTAGPPARPNGVIARYLGASCGYALRDVESLASRVKDHLR